jgi:membrane protease YdiL (CAAX protease family)
LKLGKKYLAIISTVIVLIIPIFFGIYTEFLIISEISLETLLLLLIEFVLLLVLGKIMELLLYGKKSKEKMKQHDVIRAFLNEEGKIVLLVFFPLTMIMEELIFRYYLIGFLLNDLNLELFSTIMISSLIFSLYHIHTWFRFKDLKILTSNLIFSFLLGIYNAYLLFTLGIFACIIVHFSLVLIIYYNLYKKLS